jgi:hypothetical protein
MFGSATGTFSIKGNSLGFTSQTLCGMGDIHGAPKLGVNVSNFQIWPLVCRPGDRFCGCYGNSMVQAKDLIIKETLVQCGENSPSIRSPGEPYHERSDLSGQTWGLFWPNRFAHFRAGWTSDYLRSGLGTGGGMAFGGPGSRAHRHT